MRRNNVRRCGIATAVHLGAVVGVSVVVLGAGSRTAFAAAGMAGAVTEGTGRTQPRADARPPSPAVTMAAFGLVEGWVRGWSAPEDVGAAGVEVLGGGGELGAGGGAIGGASVTLRLAGQVVGRGTDLGGGPGSVWRAAREAMRQADGRLPRGNDLVAEEALKETVGQVMISVELAGPALAIVPTPATYSDAAVALAPGIDGVAVRFGAGREGVMFPGQMLASNMLAGTAMSGLVAQASGDAKLGLVEPKELVEKHGASLLRFRVSHLAQTAPGRPPVFLERGGRVVGMEEMTVGGLREMAEGLARHLIARSGIDDRDVAPLLAQYEPWRDEGTESVGLGDSALCALALRRFAAVKGIQAEVAERAESISLVLRNKVLWELVDGGDPQRYLAAAATVRLLDPDVHIREIDGKGADLFKVVREAFVDGAYVADVPAAMRGLVALSLAHIARDLGSNEAVAGVEGAVRAAFRDTPEGELVGQMPWLGWAEQRLIEAKKRVDPKAADEVPSAVSLRRMRQQVWEHQLTAGVAGVDEQDMVGGIVFTKGRTAIPTWAAARPLAFVATMLGDERLTEPAEFSGELVRLLTSLRFLRQLQVDESAMWMYPNPERALGGIRASMWDQRMPIEASALTLLTVCETLESLERKAGK